MRGMQCSAAVVPANQPWLSMADSRYRRSPELPSQVVQHTEAVALPAVVHPESRTWTCQGSGPGRCHGISRNGALVDGGKPTVQSLVQPPMIGGSICFRS